ncbi:general secretion pathway protein K [bacterium BMS3Abin07]|nr:general secretion pathway protein K [bacterium BMS3Abin07]GBE32814.1 general secretion pathway protein K [bacterium BMS3Bbin05]HDO22200.1 general secretion pathway protein GspK [Nitrospirota bacterium]HDZ87976.1 general secretion pathway protein GspK [Nitrospirota bacterium]
MVYNETVSLYNWRDMQRLSLEAESGIEVGESFLQTAYNRYVYTYPERVDFPLPDVTGDGRDAMLISIIDENARLNINKIVNPNGTLDENSYKSFKRLLKILGIDEDVADIIADWIDKDSEERVAGSEKGAKNGYLYSIDELLDIKGINGDIYKKLLPHVTIFGNGLVNINSADISVLMSMSEDISEELAKRVISYRELKPFVKWQDLRNVAGFGTLYTSLAGRITVKGSAFSIIVSAREDKLKRSINAVIVFKNNVPLYKYWKET